MPDIWLPKIGDYTVDQIEIPRSRGRAYYDLAQTGIGVLHTVEGPDSAQGLLGAISTLRGNNSHGQPSPPHFLIGSNRIIQMRPLNKQAAALVAPGNTYAQIQIEMMGWTPIQPDGATLIEWLPAAPVLGPLVAIMRHFKGSIPLRVPDESWLDNGADMKTIWATNNTRRQAAVRNHWWPNRKGWWMHAEVPFQQRQWHYDCGKLKRRELFKLAEPVTVA